MKKISSLIAFFLLIISALFAQVGINSDNSTPDNSAMLDVKSTSKGLFASPDDCHTDYWHYLSCRRIDGL